MGKVTKMSNARLPWGLRPEAWGLTAALFSLVVLNGQTPPAASGIRDVATRSFALVVMADGSVVGWGRDPDGQAARPPSPNRMITTPVAIDLPGKVRQVALGHATQYALLENGTVVSWGTNDEGQLGNGPMGASGESGRYPKPSFTPVAVTGLTDVVQIAAGLKHAVALRKDGTVWAWGRRSNGEIGDGPPAGRDRAIGPAQVPGLTGITQIAADASHNLALRSDGRVMAWGLNHSGEIGNSSRENAWSPVEVSGLDRVVWIAAGSGGMGAGSSGAVRDDGTVWMWGTGTSALPGDGESGSSRSPDDPGGRILTPMIVKGVTGAKTLSIGSGHAAALLADGTLRMWGFNGYGQVGVATPDSTYQTRPAKVAAIADVAMVRLGGYRTMAIRKDGTLWMWGNGFFEGRPGIFGRNLRVPTRLELPVVPGA
jgi:alpha-tubulin suppressor-like RCC1 family protein